MVDMLQQDIGDGRVDMTEVDRHPGQRIRRAREGDFHVVVVPVRTRARPVELDVPFRAEPRIDEAMRGAEVIDARDLDHASSPPR